MRDSTWGSFVVGSGIAIVQVVELCRPCFSTACLSVHRPYSRASKGRQSGLWCVAEDIQRVSTERTCQSLERTVRQRASPSRSLRGSVDQFARMLAATALRASGNRFRSSTPASIDLLRQASGAEVRRSWLPWFGRLYQPGIPGTTKLLIQTSPPPPPSTALPTPPAGLSAARKAFRSGLKPGA